MPPPSDQEQFEQGLVLAQAVAKAMAEARERVPPLDERTIDERGDSRTVRTSHITEAELDDIEKALDHPPAKADHFGTMVSVLGAVVVVLKTIASPIDHGDKDRALIMGSVALGSAQIVRYFTALVAKTPLKDLAKKHIRNQRIAQGWKPGDEPVSNWKHLQKMVWAKVFELLSPKKS